MTRGGGLCGMLLMRVVVVVLRHDRYRVNGCSWLVGSLQCALLLLMKMKEMIRVFVFVSWLVKRMGGRSGVVN